MGKIYTALGLMTGTSMDGVDLSIIRSDGFTEFTTIFDDYHEFDPNLQKNIIDLRDQIFTFDDLKKLSKKLSILERELTLFQCEIINKISKEYLEKIDLIGFHGQTILHDPNRKISKQLGDGKLFSQFLKKIVVNNFRENDLKNGGQGAPLTPIFHNILANKINEKFNLGFPIYILNIGGIANITTTVNWEDLKYLDKIFAYDIGPGNCLIDEWIRRNSKKKYDKEGLIAKNGKINELILNQTIENFCGKSNYQKSLDVKDFDIFLLKGFL